MENRMREERVFYVRDVWQWVGSDREGTGFFVAAPDRILE